MKQDITQLREHIAGRYKLGKLIGEGSSGWVYRGVDLKRSNQFVAVKILKASEMADAESVARFQREVQLTQQLDHPNIVKIFSSGKTSDGLLYLVTEYFPRGSLDRYCDSETGVRMRFPRALRLLRLIGMGLGHAHSRGVVHRDLKPGNVLMTGAENIKIIDFGIGRSLHFSSALTQDQILGTPYYMSPEQIHSGEITPRTDVYGLGILAFELTMGYRPFEDGSIKSLLRRQERAVMPRLVTPTSNMPPWFEAIVHRAADKNPAGRFSDANEFVRALEANSVR